MLADAWPIALGIGRPTAAELTHQTDRVRDHLQRWRAVTVGHVAWEPVNFRSASEPVVVPVSWQLLRPSEWATATCDPSVDAEFARLQRLLQVIDPRFHRLIVRQPFLTDDKQIADVVVAAKVALELTPGCAFGRPLRALSVGGIDTKFFEHHRTLMTQFLDVLFDGEVDNLGLEGFLGALDDTDHWLLIAPLERGLPPSLRHRRHPRRRPQPRMAGGPRVRRQATCLLGRSRHLGFADAGHRTQVSAAIACAAHDARHLRCPCGAIGGARTESCGRNSTDCAH